MIHARDILDEVQAQLPPLLTTAHIMSLLQCSRRHTYRIMKRNRWPVVQDRDGTALLVPKQVVMAYLAERLEG